MTLFEGLLLILWIFSGVCTAHAIYLNPYYLPRDFQLLSIIFCFPGFILYTIYLSLIKE